VFDLFPLIKSAGRRFAFLHRVLRGEFPCFISTIKALRLPAVRPAALRYLRLAVPQSALVVFPQWRTSMPTQPGVGHPVAPAGIFAEEATGSRKFLGKLDCPFARVQSTPAGRLHQTVAVQQRGPWDVKSKGSRVKVFRRSIAWLLDWLPTLRSAGHPRPTQDSLPAAGQTLPGGLSTRKITLKGFRVASLHLIPLSQASCRNLILRS